MKDLVEDLKVRRAGVVEVSVDIRLISS
jgi:hypothetical protein